MANHPLSAAIGQYILRLKEQPGDKDAYKTLESLLIQTGDWQKLAQAAELVGDGVADPVQRRATYVRAGNLHEAKLGNDEAAARCFAKACALAPGDPDALGGFMRVLGKNGQWSAAVSALAGAVGSVSDPKRRAELLLDTAWLRSQKMDDLTGAIADLRRTIAEDPATPRFREVAEGILTPRAAWEELAMLLRSLAEATRDPVSRAAALTDAAALYRDKLGRPGDAAAVLEASAVGQAPTGKALQEAGALFRQAQRWPDVLRILDRERAVTTDRARLREILTEIAELQAGPLGDPAAAADTWTSLLKVFPDDRAAQEKVTAQLTRAGRWDDLAAIAMRALEREKDPARWRELAVSTAKIYEDRLGNADRACKLYEELAKRDPADAEVIESLTRVYEARGRWADLAATCERAAALLGEVAGKSYLHHAASLHEFRLARPDRAIALYQKLLAEDAGDEFAASALIRLHREANDPAPLAAALAAFARISEDPTARRDTLAERAGLLANALSDPLAAIEGWEAALQVETDWVPGLQGLQDAYRKSIVLSRNAPPGALRRDVAEMQLALIDVLDRELAKTAESKRRAALHREAADLYEQRHVPEQARARYEKARAEDPEDLEAYEQLARLYAAASMRAEEVQAWRDLARLRTSSRGRAEAHFIVGNLLHDADEEGTLFKIATEEEVAEQEAGTEPAAARWRRAIEEDPKHRGALEALIEDAEKRKDWDGAVQLLTQLAVVVTDPHGRAAVFTRAGDHLRLRLEDEVSAMAKYATAIALSPRHLPAGRPLADGLFRSRRWAEAEPLYRRFGADLAMESTPKGAAEAYWRAGTVLRALDRDEDAIFQWKRAIEADGTFMPALDDLAALLRKRAEWRAARDVYGRILNLAGSTEDAGRQAETHRALAVIAEALHEPDEAIDRYRKVCQIEPGDIDALTALARLYVDAGRWREALDVYEQLLPYTGDPAQAAKIYLKRGEILAERLDDPARAVDAYAAALAARPGVEVRFRLADALARSGRWMEAANERSKLADEEEEVSSRIEHLLILGAMRRDRLRDDAGAREAFERAIALDPVERTSLVALTSLYEKGQLWEPLVRVMRTSAETLDARRTAPLADLRTRIASILSDRLQDTVEAVGELRLALASSPDHDEALARMAALAPTDPAFDREALSAHHKLALRDPLRLDSLRVLGEIYARVGRGERARILADLLALMKSPHKPLGFIAEAVRKKLPPLPLWALAPEDIAGRVPFPAERGPIVAIMRLLEAASDRLYPPNMEEKGATSADRIELGKTPDPGSLPALSAAYARALGIPKLSIYRARASSVDVSIEPGKTWALLLGPKVFAEPLRESAHQVARSLWFLANGVPLLAKLKPEVYDRLVLAAIASFLDTVESERLAEKAKAKKDDLALVRRAVPRREAKGVRELAPAAARLLGEDPRGAVRAWRRHLTMSADRAALLLTGDVPGTVRRALGGGVPAEIAAREPARVAEIIRGSAEAFEVIRFASSEEFFTLRETLGFTGRPEET